jgi:hypothetical protein
MWQKMITLSITAALAGTALAQQNLEDAKRAEAQRAADEAKVRLDIRANDADVQQQLIRAQRAQAEAERAAVEERMAQRRMAADRAPDAASKQWQFFRTARATKREKVTYCGISTAEPPPVLIDQLKLSKGIGLVVDFVEPGSPAEAAGLKRYDVITKMNDQVLANAEQLGVLVRLRKPTDDAKFAVIRQGHATSINVELGEKEMEVEVENAQADPFAQNRFFALQPNGQLATTPGMMNTMVMNGGGGVAVTNVNGEIQKVWSDDQTVLNLKIKNGKPVTLIVKDKAGKEIFNGPIDTEEQRRAVPADLQQKLKSAEGAGPMQYGFGDPRGVARARVRVLTSTERDTLMVARIEKGKATYVLAFNTTDGKTLFDGSTATDGERKAVPEAVAKQLETLEKNQSAAQEFGVIGRN